MITSETNKANEISRIISLYSSNIHLTYLDYDEFLNMTKTKEFNVVSEAIKNHIIITGVEDYYRLIKNDR